MDWFYHDPGQGRVGPLSPDEMRSRYRDRRIQPDTLVWREGMREWQPLDRVSEELDLLSVKPDAALPPPLPPAASSPATFHAGPGAVMPMAAGNGYVMRPAPQRKGMSGCLIALIVVAALAVPVIGILAAIAVPAYQDYTIRSKVAMQVDARAPSIEVAVAQAMAVNGHCPADAAAAGISDGTGVDFGNVDGRCAFKMTVHDVRPLVDGKTVVFVAPASPQGEWDCTGGDLPPKYRRPQCRPAGDTAP
ncbi:GYF domain-containing protein [Cognatilysobacter lacus]|uniref:GYF domain-containing protein n=1 Tax=Cognatilysobacter lacus TaxID=1643323 RepID=UPI0022A732D5|nr:GYF domain-containing protein [Lysobacter lacus]